MRPEKLEKYRNGNFELKSKHIFAQQNLKNIRNYMINTYDLIGGSGAPQAVIDKLGFNEMLDGPQFDDLQTIIKTGMAQLPELLVKSEDKVFEELMDADKQLIEEFYKYKDLASQNYEGLDKKEQVKSELLKIQKSLFNLQVKIIFSKLRKIKHADITPLLGIINKKIEAMNNYIQEQENKFEEGTIEPNNVVPSSNVQQQSTSNVQPVKPIGKQIKLNENEISEIFKKFIKDKNISDEALLTDKNPISIKLNNELIDSLGETYNQALKALKDEIRGEIPSPSDLSMIEETVKTLMKIS